MDACARAPCVPAGTAQAEPKGRHNTVRGTRLAQQTLTQECPFQTEPWPTSRPMLAAASSALHSDCGAVRARMQIEPSFATPKNARWGLGLERSGTRTPERLAVLVLIATLAQWVLYLVGQWAYDGQGQRHWQLTNRSNRPQLSVHQLGWLIVTVCQIRPPSHCCRSLAAGAIPMPRLKFEGKPQDRIRNRQKHRPVADAQRAADIYRRSVMLASARCQMRDDGMGFSLVPCKSVIEPRLGQRLVGTVRGGGCHGKLDGGLGWPRLVRPTPTIPQNGFQEFSAAPPRTINRGNRDADARRVLQGLAPQFVDYLLTRLAWTCCIRCADRVVAFAVRKEALPHGSLGFCFDLGTGFLALEVFRVNDYALSLLAGCSYAARSHPWKAQGNHCSRRGNHGRKGGVDRSRQWIGASEPVRKPVRNFVCEA